MPDLLTGFALVAVVLTVSALASPLVERAPLSFPMLFLGLGLLLGESGVDVLRLDAHDPTLEAIAIFTLTLVLFLDAVRLRLEGAWQVPALILGPGTLLTVALIAAAAALLLGAAPVPALLLGAILASTDPVVLRDVVRDARIPRPVREALRIEAGTNDIVVLPLVLVLIAVAQGSAGSAPEWAILLGRLFVLGPAVGFVIGGTGAWLVGQIDRRFTIRREYQALFGVGLVLTAYAAATAAGGDGFLAAFAAGVAVTFFNHELCDCFFEYGETTAEMAMLLAFILFGAVLSGLLDTFSQREWITALLFALFAIGIARPLSLATVLLRVSLSGPARAFIAWFGPRGLNSLLLALLVLVRGVPNAEWLLTIAGVVVIVSVVAHGATATPAAAWYRRQLAKETLPEERESSAAALLDGNEGTGEVEDVPRITPAALAQQLAGPNPPIVLDVRTRSQHEHDHVQIPGSVRVLPDQVGQWGKRWTEEHATGTGDDTSTAPLPADGRTAEQRPPPLPPVVTYCT
jgi:sodium/hydrogen antiporter